MASFSEHFEHMRNRPHHERRRVALLSSLLITGVVAVGWMGALASSSTLAIATPSEDVADMRQNFASTKTNFSELLGAAGAAIGATSSPATITVVDGNTFSTLDEPKGNLNNTDKTVITF